ncbi:nudix hydrolase 20, chloroplastic-like [Anneissia japonica]|uniref:nudix hydrolase 20, chloroplastic-like n=1 Tax=Anneissia japonica TaxID=1529436 RepID=UPI001425B5C4|nr:nudix hydrolase 20, chloroplastic-like [Anneissia japonica]
MSWSQQMLKIVRQCNSFNQPESPRALCVPFFIKDQQVGLIIPEIIPKVISETDVFEVVRSKQDPTLIRKIKLTDDFDTVVKRTQTIREILEGWRKQDVHISLRGWRNELYSVKTFYHEATLLEMERSATSLFGVKQYGCHLNGFCKTSDGLSMWIGRRAKNKPTFPGKLDNIAAGGLSAGMTVKDCIVKECAEEASIPEHLAKEAKPVGSISYLYHSERGVFPETQFIFDLELPSTFTPQNADGEVSEFYLFKIEEVKEKIASGEFKPNCALVILDFLIRHGYISPDTEPYYLLFLQEIHSTLDFPFSS